MNITPYQIIVPLASLVAVVYVWNLVLRQKKTIWEASLWTLFWGAISFIAIYQDSIEYLTRITGIHDRENAVLLTSIGLLFFIVFYLVVRLEELEQRLTRLMRRTALHDADLSPKDAEPVDRRDDQS